MSPSLPTGRPGQALALGLTVLMIGLVWFAVAAPLLDWYGQRGAVLANRLLMAQRMAHLAAALPALRKQAATRPETSVSAALLEGDTDAIAAANLQERVQTLANTAGATISSTEALSVDHAGGDALGDRAIRLRLSLDATWPVLVRLLDAVENGPPLMLVDELQFEGSRLLIRNQVTRLQARITVTGFRHPVMPTAAGKATGGPAMSAVRSGGDDNPVDAMPAQR